MNKWRQILVIASLIVSSLLLVSTQVLAEPVVDSVTLDPEMPKVQDSFTATVQITSEETIESVYFVITGECNETQGICYPGTEQNVTLEQVDDTSTYQGDITLTHAKATYFKYKISVLADGTWTTSEEAEITIDRTSENTNGDNGNGGTNGDNGGTNGDETPGFESILLIAALIIGFVMLRKRRFR